MNLREDKKRHEAISKIAKSLMNVETLETRHSDHLDFFETAVWSLELALAAAYEAGRNREARSRKA